MEESKRLRIFKVDNGLRETWIVFLLNEDSDTKGKALFQGCITDCLSYIEAKEKGYIVDL